MPLCLIVGWLGHHIVNQAVKGFDPIFPFASAKDFCPVDIESSKIGPSTATCVLVLNLHCIAGLCRKGLMFSTPCLDAGLLVGRQDKFVVLQSFSLPDSFIEVE